MKEHTKSYVSIVTLLIALVIFVQTNVLTLMIFQLKGASSQAQTVQTNEVVENTKDTEKTQDVKEITDWTIKIPRIDLTANIQEGTDEEIINNNVGHFTNTPNIDGNIGLIAGCYGYKENHFANLEKLTEGDVIIYQYGDQRKEYKVITNVIIDQKDWSYLTKTQENKLTLITGVVDSQEQRRCVQAIEII